MTPRPNSESDSARLHHLKVTTAVTLSIARSCGATFGDVAHRKCAAKRPPNVGASA
jgi:hypothetical protein